jgi:hypothetical protein
MSDDRPASVADIVVEELRKKEINGPIRLPKRDFFTRGQKLKVKDPWHILSGYDLEFAGMSTRERVRCWTNDHDGGMLLTWGANAARGGSELSALLVAPAQTIKKVLHRHVERQRKLIKRAGRYTIGGPFVFLQLLERNAERVGKRGLAQARFQPPQAQPRSNVAINGVRKTVRH